MKITSLPGAGAVGNYRDVARKTAVRPDSSLGSDKIELSESARSFASVLKAAKETPDVRTEKVEELRQQVEAGTYHPDSRLVASKMIEMISGK